MAQLTPFFLLPETFEGLGVGSRLAYMDLPPKYTYVPIVGALLYGITTPIGTFSLTHSVIPFLPVSHR